MIVKQRKKIRVETQRQFTFWAGQISWKIAKFQAEKNSPISGGKTTVKCQPKTNLNLATKKPILVTLDLVLLMRWVLKKSFGIHSWRRTQATPAAIFEAPLWPNSQATLLLHQLVVGCCSWYFVVVTHCVFSVITNMDNVSWLGDFAKCPWKRPYSSRCHRSVFTWDVVKA